MRPLERLYRSPFGRVMSAGAWGITTSQRPFMVYGVKDPLSGHFRKFTRLSSSVVRVHKENIGLGDHVWVWHHSVLDGTEGITIGEGCQLGAAVGIFTHGSENAIRLLGRDFVHVSNRSRSGYTRGSVSIGEYTFIGSGAIITPGVRIGKGSIVAPLSFVTKSVPDHSIVVGNPARVVGSTRDNDRDLLIESGFPTSYYDLDYSRLVQEDLSREGAPQT